MRKHIYKFNQYLLENYPTIWNTRIVWMLLISIGFHLFFFLLGVFALSDPETLQKAAASSIFFKSGVVFFSIIISLLQLVVWLIYLFKNNAFKNFYPTVKTKIFLQFICYLVIVFFSITYYFSHYVGLKTYIGYKYPNSEFKKDVTIANKSAVFFSHSLDDYTIDNCKYPFPFDSIYVETSDAHAYSRYKWLDNEYIFYTINTTSSKDVKGDKPVTGYLYSKEKEDETVYFFKDTLVDILKYKPTINADSDYVLFGEKNFYKDSIYERYKGIEIKRPTGDVTYSGFMKYKDSGIVKTKFYQSDKEDLSSKKIDVSPSYKYYSKLFHSQTTPKYYTIPRTEERSFRDAQSKEVCQLLKRNDSVEIKQLLQSFLTVATKYKIKNNISADEWFNLVYHPESFKINNFIKRVRDYTNNQREVDFVSEPLTEAEKFQHEHTTNYYIETPELSTVFYNIDEVKKDTSYKEVMHVFLWLSFLIAYLIFIFRVSSLRAFIFTLISTGILMVLIPLVTMFYKYIFGGGFLSNNIALIVSLAISIVIVVVSNFFIEKSSKKVMAIFTNLSLAAFIASVGFTVALISKYQRSNCLSSSIDDCFILINKLGISFSYILFVMGVLYLYYFSAIIKKWKGLQEG